MATVKLPSVSQRKAWVCLAFIVTTLWPFNGGASIPSRNVDKALKREKTFVGIVLLCFKNHVWILLTATPGHQRVAVQRVKGLHAGIKWTLA